MNTLMRKDKPLPICRYSNLVRRTWRGPSASCLRSPRLDELKKMLRSTRPFLDSGVLAFQACKRKFQMDLENTLAMRTMAARKTEGHPSRYMCRRRIPRLALVPLNETRGHPSCSWKRVLLPGWHSLHTCLQDHPWFPSSEKSWVT